MAIYDNRVCRECGITFSGGPRAWYCQRCRKERQKKADREYRERNRMGKTRKIGSRAICANCGEYYTINGSNQKYCENCKDIMLKIIDNIQSTKYYHERVDKAERSRKRRAYYANNKSMLNNKRRLYYSQNRNKILMSAKKWRLSNPEKIREYNKTNREKKLESCKKAEAEWRQKNREANRAKAKYHYIKKRIKGGKKLIFSDCRFFKERYNQLNKVNLTFKQIYSIISGETV